MRTVGQRAWHRATKREIGVKTKDYRDAIRALGSRLREGDLVFGMLRNGHIMADDGTEIDLCRYWDQETWDAIGNMILIKTQFAAGGLTIGHAREKEGYFIPTKLTRGCGEATEKDLAAVPEWAATAYRWFWG